MKLLPQLVNLGLYDAALVHKNISFTPPRRVSMYEIELIAEDGGCSYIGDEKFKIKKGCVICAKPGQMRHTDLPYKCYYIHAIITDEELSAQLDSLPDFYAPSDSDGLKRAFCDLIEAHTLPDLSGGINTALKLLEVLSVLLKDTKILPSAAQRHRNLKVIQQALGFIDRNYTQAITLADISSHVHLSKIYFHKLFIAATGQTPHDYLMDKRIGAVKFLLAATDKPFSKIAEDSGFSSQAYMTYVFKRKTGCTPMQYKKQISLMWDTP